MILTISNTNTLLLMDDSVFQNVFFIYFGVFFSNPIHKVFFTSCKLQIGWYTICIQLWLWDNGSHYSTPYRNMNTHFLHSIRLKIIF